MSQSTMQSQQLSSYLSGANAGYLEALYECYLHDPNSVSPEWQAYFGNLAGAFGDISHADIRHHLQQQAHHPRVFAQPMAGDVLQAHKQAAVDRLVLAYRTYGHLLARTNPLSAEDQSLPPKQLTLEHYPELTTADLGTLFTSSGLLAQSASLQTIIDRLQAVYCGSIGTEYLYMNNLDEIAWIRQRLEQDSRVFSADEQLDILQQLTAAEGLEKYLANKYVGQKRFSLEGGDSFIPLVHAINDQSAKQGVKEILVGMAHRGRLNMLVNVFGKPTSELFEEFEGRKDYGLTSGDVKYHLGYACDVKTAVGSLHLMLAFNPSHLEIISAVLMGSVRARQQRRQSDNSRAVLGLVVHGDASFSGQGVVMETLNMSQTNAYKIGGVVHVIINNQVGFTTSEPTDTRSSLYCSDPAKMIDAPIFHVNGDDPEAVVYVARLAADYRATFHKDVVIDLVCYRRLGHNEADEPIATQPLMYRFIRQHPTTRELYAQQLIARQVCTQAVADDQVARYRHLLDTGASVVETLPDGLAHQYAANWKPYLEQPWFTPTNTGVPLKMLYDIAKRLEQLPPDFAVQRQVNHMLQARAEMTEGKAPIDWGYAETLAYGSLLAQGHSVRMSGEDCQRGTFAHRHAVLHDQNTGKIWTPLEHVAAEGAQFHIYDSLLSEVGAMGFEYGYASTDPETLVLWEAQYGDFANGAQVVVDQFISSAWQKWRTLCGLTLLLPHGYEGAGPEHTSARLERYLQLCAQKNIQVCVPSTPAQIFHLLRRQVLRPYRTPLVILSPKNMLRNKLAVSSLTELAEGQFQLVIPEAEGIDPNKVQRVVLCSGKVYYDLLTKRRELGIESVALLRIEQLYPFPTDTLRDALRSYSKAKQIVWCQEEPENQGAWYTMRHRFEACLAKGQHLYYAGRAPAASPAAGYMKLHLKQQQELIDSALSVQS